MAKSSRGARPRKKAKGASRKPAARKRAAKKARPKAPPTHIELRTIRKFAERHIALIDAQPAPHAKAVEIRERMRQWLADVEGSCGPNMAVPLG